MVKRSLLMVIMPVSGWVPSLVSEYRLLVDGLLYLVVLSFTGCFCCQLKAKVLLNGSSLSDATEIFFLLYFSEI